MSNSIKSSIEIIKDDKDNMVKGYIRGGVLCYVKLQDGSYKYNSTTEKEYTVDLVVDKATSKEFKKLFKKNTPKEIDTPEFKTKFKIEAPYPDADEQFVIKLKAKVGVSNDIEKAGLKAGDPVPYEWASRPKMFVKSEGGVKDVTMTTLAANGSIGDVSFNITSNDFGTFPQLTGVLVTDMIEYESTGGANASPFGEVEGGLNAGDGSVQQSASAGQQQEEEPEQEEASPSQPAEKAPGDDDIPF